MQHATWKDRYAPTDHYEALSQHAHGLGPMQQRQGWGVLLGASAGTCAYISMDVCGNIAKDTCEYID